MHVSLYRRYRPRLFGEVVGQDAANALLRSSFLEQRLSHAYLFSGPRGCGKTTAARLLAKVVNCQAPTPEGEPCCVCDSCRAVASGEHMDVMEIDGASNRGIDQIRELKSHVGLASFMGGMKVYILDEVHMLTMEAFNALLKTLEEPPSSVMFIFATTEPHKVPVTIRSRCQHIPFHRISTERIVSRLCDIARAEAIAAEDSALWEIARNADGALRDAISLFEQAVALGHGGLGMDSVRALFGGGARAEMERWIVEVREHPDDASASLKSALDLGVSPERFLDGLFPLLRDMWAFSLWGEKSFAGASLSEEEKDFIESEAPQWDSSSLRRCAMACASLFPRARFGLKNDVFSGLLLFELLAATMDVPEAPPREAPTPKLRKREAVITAARGDVPARERVTPPPAPAFQSSGDAGDTGDLPDVMVRLMKEDLPLAAALIHARVYRSENSMSLDLADAPHAAAALLAGPRARAALERAFGFEPSEAVLGEPPEAKSAVSREAPARAAAPPSSAEAISVRMGADILMSRRLDTEESTETGDIEDEQIG